MTMAPQILTTPAGEALVVLTCRDDDVLLARLGDKEAEDRMTVRLVEEAREAGTDFLLPAWFSGRMIARHNPVRILRRMHDEG